VNQFVDRDERVIISSNSRMEVVINFTI